MNNGTYEFQVIANNDFGSYQTNWLRIEVSIPNEKPNQNDSSKIPEELIQQIILYSILSGVIVGLTILYKKYR